MLSSFLLLRLLLDLATPLDEILGRLVTLFGEFLNV